MSEQKFTNKLLDTLREMATVENIQKYILGSKKDGQPRAVYDVVKDYTRPRKKKRGKKDKNNTYSLYLKAKKNKNKKKNKDKYWKF